MNKCVAMFGFGKSARLRLELRPPPSNIYKDISSSAENNNNSNSQQTTSGPIPQKNDNESVKKIPIYTNNDKVEGSVMLDIAQGKKVEHNGIKVCLIGRIDLFYDKGGCVDFVCLVKEIENKGTVYDCKEWKFDFDFDKPFESYRGLNVRVR